MRKKNGNKKNIKHIDDDFFFFSRDEYTFCKTALD